MGYDQYTVPNDCSRRAYFCCFPLAPANICPWPLVPFFQISFENRADKTTHNTFRDCRVYFFRQPFSKQLYLYVRIDSWVCVCTFPFLLSNEKWEVQSWSEQRVWFFHNNISARNHNTDGECRNKNYLKGRGGNDVKHKNWKRKNDKDMDNNNSSPRFRPLGSRVMALSIKCVSLALRTESRKEWIFSIGINCMSVWEEGWYGQPKYYFETKKNVFLINFAVVFKLLVFDSQYFGWIDLFSRDPTFITSRIFVHGFCS